MDPIFCSCHINNTKKFMVPVIIVKMPLYKLTLLVWQTKTNTCANNVDPDDMAHNELSHPDLHCLPFYF